MMFRRMREMQTVMVPKRKTSLGMKSRNETMSEASVRTGLFSTEHIAAL